MTVAAISPAMSGRRVTPARIALAALAGGAFDLAYATFAGAAAGRSFQKVWQGVASGWLGPSAGDLGWASASLGLATHFGIAAVMAGTVALAGDRLPVIYRRPWVSGTLYGLALYGVMHRIVLPLRWPTIFPRWDGLMSLGEVLVHVAVGLAFVFVLRGRQPSVS